MSYSIIDYPHGVSASFYEDALQSMAEKVLETGAAKAVYQVGGVSSPGISDLDMVIVFKHQAEVTRNFLEDLSEEERYLFIHNLYGISEDDFGGAEKFAFSAATGQ